MRYGTGGGRPHGTAARRSHTGGVPPWADRGTVVRVVWWCRRDRPSVGWRYLFREPVR